MILNTFTGKQSTNKYELLRPVYTKDDNYNYKVLIVILLILWE